MSPIPHFARIPERPAFHNALQRAEQARCDAMIMIDQGGSIHSLRSLLLEAGSQYERAAQFCIGPTEDRP